MNSRVDLDSIDLAKELRCIEYPGIVQNDEKMFETLGGIGRISQTFCEQVRRMELILHPQNRYCKPAFGDLAKSAGVLIKVTVRVPKNGHRTPTDQRPHKVKVLGHCKKSFKFTTLCDFQFLPIIRTPDTNHFQYIYDKIMPQTYPPHDWLKDPNQPLLPVPYLFARSDSVQQNTFRNVSNCEDNDDNIGSVRNRQPEMKTLATFSLDEPVPEKPNPLVYKFMIAKLVNDQQFQIVKKLFDECPIWNRVSLMYEANVSSDKLKVIIPALSYHYKTGPWRTMYVRFGYDPSKHFEARYYQIFDYRIRFSARLGAHIKAKRSAKNPRVCPRRSDKDPEKDFLQDINYPYLEENRLPRGRQSFYRYCDLRLPKVQEMLDKIPTPLSGAKCNMKTGWLPSNFSTEVRGIVHSSIQQTIQTWRNESGFGVDADDVEDDFDDEEYDEEEEQDDGDIDDIQFDEFLSEKTNSK